MELELQNPEFKILAFQNLDVANNFIQHGHRACELCHFLDLDLQTPRKTLQREVWKFP